MDGNICLHYSLTRCVRIFLACVVILGGAGIAVAQQQDIPEEVRQAIREQGMTVEEARQQAQRLGIDLSNPQEAARRARELGISESRITRALNAVQQRQQTGAQRPRPVMRDTVTADTAGVARQRARRRQLLRRQRLERQRRERPTSFDELRHFGYNTFDQVPDAFQPSRVGPVDGGYLIGPQDELRLTVWGAAEFTYDLPVDREGRVYVPNVGQFTVAGMRLDSLRKEMRRWLSRSYAGLESDPPSVHMDLTVTRIRPIEIFVLGRVDNPGGYQVSSYSTVFNALYSVGGPSRDGSLRQIRVIRNGTVIDTVDMYNHLLRGFEPDPVRLQSGDRIFIPQRGKTVGILGEVHNPAIYELQPGETAEDLIEFAGGLRPEAYVRRFQIQRIVPFQERENPSIVRTQVDPSLRDVLNGERNVSLADGDQVRILSVLEKTDQVATVSGAVLQPGKYQISDSVQTVRDLIGQADGLTEAAYRQKAELFRIAEDSSRKMISLNLTRVMDESTEGGRFLQSQDSLRVYSVRELRDTSTVHISGQVRRPGTYILRDSMTVRDLLFRGGGLSDPQYLKDVYVERADLFRFTPSHRQRHIVSFNLKRALNDEGFGRHLLQPQDSIRVYSDEVAYNRRNVVHISGAVKQPGRFLLTEDMSLEDLILQAGGFTPQARLTAVEVTRPVEGQNQPGARQRARTLNVPLLDQPPEGDSLSYSLDDTTRALVSARRFDLENRDRVFVRQDPDYQDMRTVHVRGEVRFPGEYVLTRDNERLSELVSRAGGLRATAYPNGGRLLRVNNRPGGEAYTTSREDSIRLAQQLTQSRDTMVAPTGTRARSGQRRGQGQRPQMAGASRDSLIARMIERRQAQDTSRVIVEMGEAIAGDPTADVILQPGDVVFIPPRPNAVAVRGNVGNPGLIKHESGRRVSYYLDRAGGVLDDTEKVFLTQASGATFEVGTGLFDRNPKVEDGAVIRVTEEPPQQAGDFNLQQTLTETMSVLSTALTIIILAQRVTP